MTDVVIPACNEAATIGAVVDACRASAFCTDVVVVVNGTTDETAAVAFDHGAVVVVLPYSPGDKGNAMSVGLGYVVTPAVLFCDGDLVGLSPEHIDGMLTLPPADGQLCGLVDTPAAGATRYLPPITGQRRLPTDIARQIPLAGSGYEAELRIDAALGKMRTPHRTVVLHGVTNPTRAVVSPWRWLKMAGAVAATSAYLLPELVAYERIGSG